VRFSLLSEMQNHENNHAIGATGQMPFRVPNGGTVFTGVGEPSLIAPGRLTLPAMLRDNGYATACLSPYCCVRNSEGVMPVAERKARVKALWS
jgi:hypothetical protein